MAAAAHEPWKKAAAVTEQILICYDGSHGAERAVDAAAALLAPRHAVVLNVAPAMTFAEGVAATSSLVPGVAFEDLNRAEALRRAEAGAAHAPPAGFAAEARGATASTTWQGIVDVAGELDVAAIVIGSRGVQGFREFAKRSVSHDVDTHARATPADVPPVTT